MAVVGPAIVRAVGSCGPRSPIQLPRGPPLWLADAVILGSLVGPAPRPAVRMQTSPQWLLLMARDCVTAYRLVNRRLVKGLRPYKASVWLSSVSYMPLPRFPSGSTHRKQDSIGAAGRPRRGKGSVSLLPKNNSESTRRRRCTNLTKQRLAATAIGGKP